MQSILNYSTILIFSFNCSKIVFKFSSFCYWSEKKFSICILTYRNWHVKNLFLHFVCSGSAGNKAVSLVYQWTSSFFTDFRRIVSLSIFSWPFYCFLNYISFLLHHSPAEIGNITTYKTGMEKSIGNLTEILISMTRLLLLLLAFLFFTLTSVTLIIMCLFHCEVISGSYTWIPIIDTFLC